MYTMYGNLSLINHSNLKVVKCFWSGKENANFYIKNCILECFEVKDAFKSVTKKWLLFIAQGLEICPKLNLPSVGKVKSVADL